MMATRRTRLMLLILQWRRRFAMRRMLKELNWFRAWSRSYRCK